jgi:threonine dehydrogenase-like Zn-dependent dehydrogenase
VDLQDTAAHLVFSREIRVRELVTHRYRLEHALSAFDTASHPAPGVLKVMLEASV